jgi:hypothetical protein
MPTDLKVSADAAAYANRSASECAVDLAVNLGKAKNILPDAISSSAKKVIEALGIGAEVIKKMNESIKTRRERYMDYFQRDHASLAVVFADTRAGAKAFVAEHGYDRVTEMTGKARGALSEFRSAAQTSGQTSDADAFVSDVTKKLDQLERDAKAIWDNFVKDHELEFFGAFGADIEAMLVGSARIDEHYRTVLSIDLHGLATRWMDDARKMFPVDLSNVDDATKELLQDELRKSIDEYVKTGENVDAEAEPSNFETWIKGSARSLWEKISR